MICARRVFRCFKTLERWGDKITGAAGPYFVGLAVLLITMGVLAFFDVIAPSLPIPIITVPLCLLVTLNLYGHYYLVCTIKPGFVDEASQERGRGILWATPKKGKGLSTGLRIKRRGESGVKWSGETKITPALLTKCRRCGVSRPERSHHCRVCGRCVLKYDHHCPVRVNQCVGLHNERHFVLFMAYFVLGTFLYSVFGYHKLLDSLGITYIPWVYHVPEVAFALTYILSVVLFLAVGVMLTWHLLGVAKGETSVEAHDHEEYRKKAKERGESFVNSYDLGKRKNLQLFFNIGPDGYSLYTLLLPLRIMPYTDGRSWARREGLDRHKGILRGEELTDEDDDYDDGEEY